MGTRLGQNCVHMVCVNVYVCLFAQSVAQNPQMGGHVYILHVQICLCAHVYSICLLNTKCMYTHRCYYGVRALSDVGDEGLEFNLCHEHTGHS